MSRINELSDAVESINNNGGMDTQEWIAFCLSDIAVSLARIVDALEAEKGEKYIRVIGEPEPAAANREDKDGDNHTGICGHDPAGDPCDIGGRINASRLTRFPYAG